MNGIKVVFDTNALIQFFNGYPALQDFIPASLCISVITLVEYLSFPKITQQDRELVFDFIREAEVVDIKLDNSSFIEQIVLLRSKYKIKLPDAIIAATALTHEAILITRDKDFQKIQSLKVSTY